MDLSGYNISADGVEMTDEHVRTLRNIRQVKSLKETRHVLDIAHFQRPFIKDYSR